MNKKIVDMRVFSYIKPDDLERVAMREWAVKGDTSNMKVVIDPLQQEDLIRYTAGAKWRDGRTKAGRTYKQLKSMKNGVKIYDTDSGPIKIEVRS